MDSYVCVCMGSLQVLILSGSHHGFVLLIGCESGDCALYLNRGVLCFIIPSVSIEFLRVLKRSGEQNVCLVWRNSATFSLCSTGLQ
jgi:hypothetical protein